MDKYYQLLELLNFSTDDLEDFLYDHDISTVDVLAALDNAGLIDVDEMIIRMRYNLDEEEEEE